MLLAVRLVSLIATMLARFQSILHQLVIRSMKTLDAKSLHGVTSRDCGMRNEHFTWPGISGISTVFFPIIIKRSSMLRVL